MVRRLAPRDTHKLEDHPFSSSTTHCTICIFANTLHSQHNQNFNPRDTLQPPPHEMDAYNIIRCTQKFRTGRLEREANGTALCHYEQSNRYFVSQYSEFCHHNPLCCFSTSVYCCWCRYRLSPETFGYTLVPETIFHAMGRGIYVNILHPVIIDVYYTNTAEIQDKGRI
jgi:hypothetical protein